MENGTETKQVKIVFVYSDMLRQRNYRIQFDDGKECLIDTTTCKEKPYDFELINNEKTQVKLKGRYENPHGISSPEQNMPSNLLKLIFPSKQVKHTIYKSFLRMKSKLRILNRRHHKIRTLPVSEYPLSGIWSGVRLIFE